MSKARSSYQLHIQLCDTKPSVWRRIAIADTMNLAGLHRAIQAVMGWENQHLYEFEIAGQRYGIPDADTPDDPTMDARRYTVGQLLQGQALPMRYIYDFGDFWAHRIKLEAVTPIDNPDMRQQLPACMEGRNACPPEDCGGPQGFADLMAAQQDPQHARHEDVPEDFCHTYFDLQRAQARLYSLALLQRSSSVASSAAATVAALP